MLKWQTKLAVCSSIMPQKKNPWTFETSASFCARDKGYADAAWITYKGVPYAFTMESMDVISNFWPALEDIGNVATLLEVSMKDIKIRKDRAIETARGNFTTVTELANTLVRVEGISFRAAHEIVAHVVGYLTEHNMKANEIHLDTLNSISNELFHRSLKITEEQIQEALDPIKNAYSKKVLGGTAPEEVDRQLDILEDLLKQDEAIVIARENSLKKAKVQMEEQVSEFLK